MSQVLGIWSEGILILGIILTAAGIIYRAYLKEKEPLKGRVSATVVEIVTGPPDIKGAEKGIHDYFYPVFAYYANGQLRKEQYEKGSNPPSFYKGQKVALKFDLKNPGNFQIEKKEREEQLGSLLYFLGLGMILAGLILYLLFGLRVLG